MKCQVDKSKVMYIGKIIFYFTCPVSDAELVIIIQEWNDGVKISVSMWALCSHRQTTPQQTQNSSQNWMLGFIRKRRENKPEKNHNLSI